MAKQELKDTLSVRRQVNANQANLKDQVVSIVVSDTPKKPATAAENSAPPASSKPAKTDAAAILAQMLHRQTQPARARRAQHQPVGAARKVFIRQRFAEHLIIDAEILHRQTALGHPGGAACL